MRGEEISLDINKVGNRGTLFTFYDLGIPTNVYVISGNKYLYIIDTYLGPDIMDKINQHILEKQGYKTMMVVNTHSHWDHVWGNCLYKSSLIISHVFCREIMKKEGHTELKKHDKYKRGEVAITYPNLTFTDKLYFEEDNILIYHTPGHTEDGISIVDLEDRVLYGGDNLERPIPYITSKNLMQYEKVLEDYLKLNVDTVIGGHTGCEDKDLIRNNLYYIRKLQIGDTAEFEHGEYTDTHRANMKSLI